MAEIAIVELEDFALELAHTAGGIAQAHFRQPIEVENKSPNAFDPVTNADRAIERVLRTAIVARYPEHGIVAEEEGERAGAGEYTWYIDPIDGTRAFMTGSPLWGTLIGLTRGAQPMFGLLVQPVLEEVFFGGPSGSWLIKPERRDRLKSRGCKTLAAAVLDEHASRHVHRRSGRGISHARRPVSAHRVRRRLLQLRDVGGRSSRPRRRKPTEAIRHRAADSRARRRGLHRHRLAAAVRRSPAATSWRPAAASCTARRWPCSAADPHACAVGSGRRPSVATLRSKRHEQG